MVRKQKSSNELLNCRLLKLGNTQKQRDFRSFSDNNDHKDHLKRCSPIIFTNWKEISQLKKCRNKTLSITSTEAQQTVCSILYLAKMKSLIVMVYPLITGGYKEEIFRARIRQ